MSNPTTPFGWQMPENTDLVTDLPADFEVFGQAVATDLQYLLGGTTGQVLAKASGTDLDFDWVTDATGMTNPMTTTGDSIYSSSGSTPARLGIGSAGQVLTVASGLPSWAAPVAGGMTLISTTTLTGASVTISSIPGTYKNLVLQFRNVRAGSDGGIRVRVNGDSNTRYRTYGDTGNNLGGQSFNATEWTSEYGGNSNNDSSSANWIIYDYAYTTTYKIGECFNWFVGYNNTANSDSTKRYFGYNQTAAITSLDLFSNIGSWSNGTVLLYGVS